MKKKYGPVLHRVTQSDVLTILRRGPLTLTALSTRLGVSRRVVAFHIASLRGRFWIESDGPGSEYRLLGEKDDANSELSGA